MDDIVIEVTGIDEFSILVLETPGLLTPIDGPNRITPTTLTTFPANTVFVSDGTNVVGLTLSQFGMLFSPPVRPYTFGLFFNDARNSQYLSITV